MLREEKEKLLVLFKANSWRWRGYICDKAVGEIKITNRNINDSLSHTLPIFFNEIEGSFTYTGTRLYYLDGFPKKVNGKVRINARGLFSLSAIDGLECGELEIYDFPNHRAIRDYKEMLNKCLAKKIIVIDTERMVVYEK